MIHLAYDHIAYSDDRAQMRVRPNCPQAAGRFSTSTLLPMTLLPGLGYGSTDELVRERRPFVYPLELGWDWSQTLSTGPRSMAPDLPRAVIESIQAGRASLLVTLVEAYHLEPDQFSPRWLFDYLQDFIREHDLPPHRVWFVSGRVIAIESFAAWLQQRGLYEPEVFRFRAMPPWAAYMRALYRANREGWDVAYHFDDDLTATVGKRPFSAAEFADRYVQPEALAAERQSGALRPKRFLSMNRHRWPHRLHIAAYLQGRGYLDGSLVSFPEASAEHYARFPAPVLDEFLQASWLKLQPKLPLAIDEGPPPPLGFASDALSKLQNGWPYRQAYFNLVTETSVLPPAVHSEKLLKPMLNLQPFICVAPADTLRYLRALGFQTFSRLIDENYDLPADPATRLTRMFQAIDQLGQLSPAQARDLYVEALPELEHNRTHLIEGPHQFELLLAEIEAQLP